MIKGILELPKAVRQTTESTNEARRLDISPPVSLIFQYKPLEPVGGGLPPAPLFLTSLTGIDETMSCNCNERGQSAELTSVTIRPKRVSGASIDSGVTCPLSLRAQEGVIQVKLLQKLSKTLYKLFLCADMGADDLDLSAAEIRVLKEVVVKKFTGTAECDISNIYKINDKTVLLELLNSVTSEHKSMKRVEENNKFVYKYAMKYLKRLFFLRKGLRNCQMSEVSFYEFYFKSTAEHLKLPIENFYDPLYKTLNKNPAFKTVNNKYMGLIFSSSQFKSDFFNFLKNEFKKTYNDAVPGKLHKFFRKLRAELLNTDPLRHDGEEAIDRFSRRLQRNRKCKLPWTYREISCAVAQFNSLIYYY